MAVKYSNNASTTLASSITSSATSLTVSTGTGALFPTLSGSDFFFLTLVAAATMEIVKVTAVSGDTFTVVRGQDGTTPAAFSAGAMAAQYLTKGMFDQLKADAVTDGLTSNRTQPYDSTILKSANIGVTVQGYDSTTLKSATIGTTVQAWDADLDSIAALTGTSGFAKKTAANTWSLDTNLYVSEDSATGSAYLPTGTTAQRTASPTAGLVRYNSTTQKFEGYGSAWGNLGGGAAIGDTAPANPGTGDLWWNSLDGHLYVYYGSIWVDAFAGGEGQYLPLTGGTISGNIGLGIALSGWTSATALQVQNTALEGRASNPSYGTFSANAFSQAGVWKYISSDYASRYTQYLGSHIWFTAPLGTAGATISGANAFVQAMTLDSSGNLSNVGNLSLNTGALATYFRSSGAAYTQIGDNQTLGAGTAFVIGSSPAYLGFNTAGAERGRVDNVGNLIIGGSTAYAGAYGRFTVYPATTSTTTVGANQICIGESTFNSNYRLQIGYANYSAAYKGSIQTYTGGVASDLVLCGDGGNLLVGYTGSSSGRVYIKSATSDSSSFAFNLINSSGTALMYQRSDGYLNFGLAASAPYNVTTANTANAALGSDGGLYRSTSSARYKNSIANAVHGLAEVLKLRPVTYKGNNDGDTVFGGLIAEEVHDAGLTEFVQYNDEGKPDALAYGNMVSLAFKAIQELTTRLEALEAH